MEPTDLLDGIFAEYPFLAVIGPMVGFIMAKIKDTGKVAGFWLLLVAALVTLGVIGAYGLAESWTVTEWRKTPLATLVILAFSQLTSVTTLHARDTLTKKKNDEDGT
jgi:uncharacterized membrane protein YbhN (UPF0104 family)